MGTEADSVSRTRAYRFRPWLVVALVVALSAAAATTAHVLATSVAGDSESISSTDRPVSAPNALVDDFREKLAPRRVLTLDQARAAAAAISGGSLIVASTGLLLRQRVYPRGRDAARCGALCSGLPSTAVNGD